MSQNRFISIGECMIELRHQTATTLNLGFAGDTFNVALYLARLQDVAHTTVHYFTALGTDPYSNMLLEAWGKERIHTSLVDRIADKMPGLYFIRTDPNGERHFFYYRNDSAARAMLSREQGTQGLATLSSFSHIYCSGVSFAILSPVDRDRLLTTLHDARQKGSTICFDTNYRPKLWPNAKIAQDLTMEILKCVDIGLPTLDDEQILFGETTSEKVAERFFKQGVREVVVKRGPEACYIATPHSSDFVAATKVAKVVDTTSAGDSFNAAYLAARMLDHSQQKAAQWGHQLAGVVVTHPGAVIPLEAMPKLS